MTPLSSLPRLHLIVRTLGTQGGTERMVHTFARWLMAHNADVHVWCGGVTHPIEGLPTHRLRPTGRGRVGRLWAARRWLRQVPQDGLRVGFLRIPGLDVLRAGGGTHRAWLARAGRSRLADAAELAADHEALTTAGRVVVNSELSRAHVLAEGVPVDAVHVVRNGVDSSIFRPRPAPRGTPPFVAFVGRGFHRKGLRTALAAVARHPHLRLRVLGHDPRTHHYREVARLLGLSHRVDFIGSVDHPAQHLAGARALLHPTRYDPSANVVLESLACGVPPLTTRHDGAAEVVPMPWMVLNEADDVAGLSRALHRVLDTEDLAQACRAAALPWSVDRASADLVSVLQACA